MPDATRAEAEPGRVGLTVVFARRNEITAAIAMARPRLLRMAAAASLAGELKLKGDDTRVVSHMRSATPAQTSGGGIFNSRAVPTEAPSGEAVKRERFSRLAKNPAATMS